MSTFNNNRNAFLSAIQPLKTDFHAFTVVGVPKGTKTAKQQKRAITNQVTNDIDSIDTNDFGIRIIILKVKD